MAAPRRSATMATLNIASGFLDASELDKYTIVSNIGKGSFGVISKVKRHEDGKIFAMKQLDYGKMSEKDRKQMMAEVAILESLKHRNIVQLYQKIRDPKQERIYILMEYCTSGDLGSVIRKAQRAERPLDEDKIWNIFLQITSALHHCHCPDERSGLKTAGGRTSVAGVRGHQVLHRDLKPENVFLSDDFVKLGDFGLSKDMGNAAFTSTYVGTPLYMPPEILQENRYDTKSDIWSLGCLVFELCTLASPFSNAQTQEELIRMVKSGRLPPIPDRISPPLKHVIRSMLQLNPAKRPSTGELLEMDEMKLHRKLFTVQNQTALVIAKRDELKSWEEKLVAQSAALSTREEALAAREAFCSSKEEENKETQRKLNVAAEALRGQWDRLRGERDQARDPLSLGLPLPFDRDMPRRISTAPQRPPLEERATIPIATSRFPHLSDFGTPSKIPAPATLSPTLEQRYGVPGHARNITPLRKNATKSLGNLAQEYRAQGTPARAAVPFPAHLQSQVMYERQRMSIGSPGEYDGRAGACEDITMASLASPAPPGAIGLASPFVLPRPRRSSIAPANMASAAAESASAAASGSVSPVESGTDGLRPTMIPGPSYSYMYREQQTPAKWSAGPEEELPSPFLKRPQPSMTAGGSYPPLGHLSAPAHQLERQPLGAIQPQPTSAPASVSAFPSSMGVGKGKAGAPMPRSKSGNLNLHQHVLRANMAAQTAGTGGAAAKGDAGPGEKGSSRDGSAQAMRSRAAAVARS